MHGVANDTKLQAELKLEWLRFEQMVLLVATEKHGLSAEGKHTQETPAFQGTWGKPALRTRPDDWIPCFSPFYLCHWWSSASNNESAWHRSRIDITSFIPDSKQSRDLGDFLALRLTLLPWENIFPFLKSERVTRTKTQRIRRGAHPSESWTLRLTPWCDDSCDDHLLRADYVHAFVCNTSYYFKF